jgi:hypothetical protein
MYNHFYRFAEIMRASLNAVNSREEHLWSDDYKTIINPYGDEDNNDDRYVS